MQAGCLTDLVYLALNAFHKVITSSSSSSAYLIWPSLAIIIFFDDDPEVNP